jgi:hypothetical protein
MWRDAYLLISPIVGGLSFREFGRLLVDDVVDLIAGIQEKQRKDANLQALILFTAVNTVIGGSENSDRLHLVFPPDSETHLNELPNRSDFFPSRLAAEEFVVAARNRLVHPRIIADMGEAIADWIDRYKL